MNRELHLNGSGSVLDSVTKNVSMIPMQSNNINETHRSIFKLERKIECLPCQKFFGDISKNKNCHTKYMSISEGDVTFANKILSYSSSRSFLLHQQ